MVLKKENLYFKCKACGRCCTGSPGFVWLAEEEIAQIAEFLKISVSLFMRRYTRLVMNRYSLTELSKNYDCVFLKEGKCQIYSVRPKQCKTFPWWVENLKSEEAWLELQNRCPGTRAPSENEPI